MNHAFFIFYRNNFKKYVIKGNGGSLINIGTTPSLSIGGENGLNIGLGSNLGVVSSNAAYQNTANGGISNSIIPSQKIACKLA